MIDKSNEYLDAALSLLPREKARQARSEILQSFQGQKDTTDSKFHWVDFNMEGMFLRGGISDIHSLEAVIVTNSQEDTEISNILRISKNHDFDAGTFQYDPQSERFHWLLPVTKVKNQHDPELQLRGLSISYPVFRTVFRKFNAKAALSSREEQVVFQLVAGIDLRKAAEIDGVSYETKRLHVKNASQKLSCTGQKEILRKVLGQMVHFLTASDAGTASAEIAETFLSAYLANDVRLSVQRQKNGRMVRYLECGPSDGTPVIMIHGMMFPITLCGLARHLNDARIRLIIPIRSGFLDFVSVSGLSENQNLIAQSLEDIALFIEQNNLAPAAILGQSLGAIVAVQFADWYPKLVSHLVLQSTNLTRAHPSKGNQAGTFYNAMRQLAGEPELFNLINQQYTQYYADEKTCKDMLFRLFAESKVDKAVLDGQYSGTPAYSMFAEIYKTSTYGMTMDFSFTMRFQMAETNRLAMPVAFIHGSEDPLTGIDELKALAERADSHRVLLVEKGGHFVAVSHAPEVWSHVARVLQH